MIELGAVVAGVIIISAFCSICEAALYAVPVSHIETLKSQNSRSAKALYSLRQQIDEPITAILSLNTVANTAGASIAGALAAKALGADWLAVFSILLTVGILFFSEVLPKTLGVVYCRPISMLVSVPLLYLVKLFFPIIWVCGFATRAITGKS